MGKYAMTQVEFHRFLDSLQALSPEQMRQLRRELDNKLTAVATPPAAADVMLQRRLVEAGLLSEIKPSISDQSAYHHRKAVPIQGEPLSETVIRERR